jgi:hypothetical protein
MKEVRSSAVVMAAVWLLMGGIPVFVGPVQRTTGISSFRP